MPEFVEFSVYREDVQRDVPLLVNVDNIVALGVDTFGHTLLFTVEGGDPWQLSGTYRVAVAALRRASKKPPPPK